MDRRGTSYATPLFMITGFCLVFYSSFSGMDVKQTASLVVDASEKSLRQIPRTMFGISFEEINHSGAGGLWGELVNNRGSFKMYMHSGFEAGGQNTPSNFSPWTIIGNESLLHVSTDRSSCFDRNKVALRMEVLCNSRGSNVCPVQGVGIYNPGFWGMNIEQGKKYKVTLYIRASQPIEISISFIGSKGQQILATGNITAGDVTNWTKKEIILVAHGTDHNSRLQFTTRKRGVIWFDQVSAMPLSTHKGHGFRADLFNMLADLKPGFIRFPGGSFVEGEWLFNAYRWKDTIGPWEERPGHFGDVWQYWTDDGLGFFEYLQLAEDLGALPVWVFNNGISLNDQVDTSLILPFVQEILDAIEFARGDSKSKWGSVRAAMEHTEPFDLRYVAVGNQDCGNKNYRGNYNKFYSAIKRVYPDIKIISNCDGSYQQLDHPADLYDFHVYTSANTMFSMAHNFDHTPRRIPKAFVSEYAVTGDDAGRGSLLKAIAEAGFLIGLETNSDVVEMASNAPLFVNTNDWSFKPDAIVFDSSKVYGTPSYWMQHFFKESNGATLLNSKLQADPSTSVVTSAISWNDVDRNKSYLRIKIVNFGSNKLPLGISVDGVGKNPFESKGSKMTILTSTNVKDENSFSDPRKVAPFTIPLKNVGSNLNVVIPPHSLTSIDLLRKPNAIHLLGSDTAHKIIIFRFNLARFAVPDTDTSTMNQEYERFIRSGDDLRPTRSSIAASLTHPFARISSSPDQNRFLVDNEPEIYSVDDDGEDDDLAEQISRDCGYSKPFLFLDMVWNMAFVLVSVFVILTTIQERPSTPLRLWISGYAVQCILHMGFVWAEYQRRSIDDFGGFQDFHFHGVFSFSSLRHNRVIEKLESINTVLSSIWWVFGFYWIVVGGQLLVQDSPRLYWLSVLFLAFDVFFLIFCIAVASIVFLVLFCCFPILATVAYVMTIGDGASENDIRSLPKYLYRHQNHTFEDERKQVQLTVTPLSSHNNSMAELILPPEDSECCICLYKYIDGVELCSLPCNHHFHHKCIAKWLRINATCPLCKLDILRGDMLV
ncbi:Alpha-L-arabinofuranosidase 1 [Dorcoceras hygrometricum]|uniref:non-reducing end alpha-L-arabinofuranosidase n=1 Tax=Dorcoceras hygrometricum TaxID=472368 RepID=A0A2Z7CNV3_9LAMI|nr:Alpha-L-arabinofuranosidase 1 [Dorcoceras hygrometricum]